MSIVGNEYYLLRKKNGRDKKYTAEELLDKANEYFSWCLENPLIEPTIQKRKLNRDEENIELFNLPKMRPFSIQGFCNFAEIVIQTFHNYENPNVEGKEMTEEHKDLLEVTTRIRGIIENQQFEGAAAGFLNPNIIARKLGLIDKKNIELDGKVIGEGKVVMPDGMDLDEFLKKSGL